MWKDFIYQIKTEVLITFTGYKNVSRGNFETLPIVILPFRVCFFPKRETEALLADAGFAHVPEMLPNRQVKTNYCLSYFCTEV